MFERPTLMCFVCFRILGKPNTECVWVFTTNYSRTCNLFDKAKNQQQPTEWSAVALWASVVRLCYALMGAQRNRRPTPHAQGRFFSSHQACSAYHKEQRSSESERPESQCIATIIASSLILCYCAAAGPHTIGSSKEHELCADSMNYQGALPIPHYCQTAPPKKTKSSCVPSTRLKRA